MMPIAKPLFHLTAADLMNPVVITVPRQMSLTGAAHLLAQNHISGAPVVDDGGRCIGVVSATDFVFLAGGDKKPQTNPASNSCFCSDWAYAAVSASNSERSANVERVMTADPVMAHRSVSIGDLARSMIDAHIHRVIIVDEDDRPVGIVTATDLLAALARAEVQSGQDHPHFLESFLYTAEM